MAETSILWSLRNIKKTLEIKYLSDPAICDNLYNVLNLSWDNSKHRYRLGEEWTESRPEEEDSRVLLVVCSQPRKPTLFWTLSKAMRSEGLLHSHEPLWTVLSNSGIPNRGRKWTHWSVFKEGMTKMIVRLEHLCYDESWGCSARRKERSRETLSNHPVPKEYCRKLERNFL